jgi:hypothetical protein
VQPPDEAQTLTIISVHQSLPVFPSSAFYEHLKHSQGSPFPSLKLRFLLIISLLYLSSEKRTFGQKYAMAVEY